MLVSDLVGGGGRGGYVGGFHYVSVIKCPDMVGGGEDSQGKKTCRNMWPASIGTP